MNRKILSFSILFFLSLMLFQACKKDRTTVVISNPTNNTTKANKLNILNTFKSAAPSLQTFTINAANGSWITGAKGCKFYFPANALLDASNNPVTGNVTIELKEYMNKADMLFSGVTVTSGNSLLESGGMFYIMAKQNGQELHLKNNVGFQMMVPQADNGNNPMDFWNGVENLIDSSNVVDSLNKVDWEKVDSVVIENVKDTAQGGGGGGGGQPRQSYFGQFNYFQFGYCNIDREAWKFSTIINKFRIKLPAGCNDTNSTSLLLFKNYNCCAWCYWNNYEDLMSTYYQLPLGETLKVLVYKKTGNGEDDLAYAVLEINLVDNTLADFSSLPLIPCTNQQLEDVIKAL